MINYQILNKASYELDGRTFLLLYKLSVGYELAKGKNKDYRFSYNDIKSNSADFASKREFYSSLDMLVSLGYIEVERKNGCKARLTSCKSYQPVPYKNRSKQTCTTTCTTTVQEPVPIGYNHSNLYNKLNNNLRDKPEVEDWELKDE